VNNGHQLCYLCGAKLSVWAATRGIDLMAQLNLWFAAQAGAAACELERTTFIGNPFSGELIAVRGKTAGAYKNAGTFQWTPGVKAISVIFLTALSRYLKKSKVMLPVLGGGRGSLASSLDYALNKQPEWLFDMFGADANGNCYLRQLLLRSNSGRRRSGPVRISLNEEMLTPDSIEVYVADALIDDPEELERLALSIISTDAKANDEGPSENGQAEKIAAEIPDTLPFDIMFPVIVPLTDKDLDDVHEYEKEFFPNSHATRKRLSEWREHDHNNYMCIKETGHPFMAYYLILFLKPQSMKDYLAGDLLEHQIAPDHLVSPSRSVYVKHETAHICTFASRIHASMFTVDLLWHLIGRLLDLATTGRLSTIYAEPETIEGQALLDRFGFVPVRGRKGKAVLELKLTPVILREWGRRYRLRTFCRGSNESDWI
jgi:hypothetical protein